MITISIYLYCRSMIRLGANMATLARVRMPDLVAMRALHVSRALAAVQIKMPSLSPTMEEGTIVKWMKVRQWTTIISYYSFSSF